MQPVSMPPFWESLLKGYVKKTFYADTRKKSFADRAEFTEGDYRFFFTGVRDLNVAFTQERHNLPHNYLNKKELRSGYILYFLPANALKVAALLSEIPTDQFLTPEGGQLKIIDVGSGPGTGMLGVFYYLENLLRSLSRVSGGGFPSGVNEGGKGNQMGGQRGESGITPRSRIKLSLILIDQNRQALNDAAALYEGALANIKKVHPTWQIYSELRLVTADLFSDKLKRILEPQEADLVLALNVLSELPRPKRLPIVESLLKGYLTDRGRLLIMEPALRLTSRDLMGLRDEILQRESGVIHAPCLHQADCPMLKANERDWCHTYIPWDRPAWIEKIDRLVAIRKDYLKCSYMILAPMGGIGVENRDSPPDSSRASGFAGARRNDVWRVVSGPLNSKGKTERLLCGEGGLPDLLRVVRLDKDSTQFNGDLDWLERGDLAQMTKTGRIGRETKVRKI